MVQALKDDRAVSCWLGAAPTWPRSQLVLRHDHRPARSRAGPASAAAARALIDSMPAPTYQLRTAIPLRLAKRLERDVDVLLTGDNEADFGGPGAALSTETFAPEFREVIAAAATSGG
jgi:hypothetical protein